MASKPGCYAVARGRKPGIYMEWKDCAAQVLNFYGAKYRKFLNAADAELWISENSGPATTRTSSAAAAPAARTANSARTNAPTEVPTVLPPAAKAGPVLKPANDTVRLPASDTRPASPTVTSMGTTSSSIDRTPALSPNASSPRGSSTPPITTGGNGVTSSDPIVVFTDGSCRGNGKVGSTAGVGVWWGPDDPRNVSARCPGDQTNNRAELIAIIRVLETAPKDRPLEIKTDSEYSINSMNVWLHGWKRKGWVTASGKPVKNLPLIQYADLLLEERRVVLRQKVDFVKVEAHTGIEGNEAADTLANQGALRPPVPEQDWHALMDATRARMRSLSSPSVAVNAEKVSVPRKMSSRQKQSAPSEAPAAVSRAAPATAVRTPTNPNPPPAVSISAESRLPSISSLSASGYAQHAQMPAELYPPGMVHGRKDVRISQKELEIYAGCLLDDDELMREAQTEGVWQ